ncbi:transmembrane protease serine 12-like isoform X1 [Choristoneura fumiferana]|uniref:transmembrane protease serine 12-like isoform X1 n=1 Tax=Choristoneura fumiferana TaxID=7141 RepID=UPI003D157F73
MNNSDASGTGRTCLVIMNHIYCLFFLAVAYGLSAVSAQDGPALGCVLPEYPKNGIYTVFNKPDATPGQSYDTVVLSLTCNPGYRVLGTTITACSNNTWSQPLPQCTQFCKLTPHTSVTYYCKVTGDHQLSGRRLCNEYEPSGTVVVPECKRPIYYYSGVLLNMRCVDGSWDHIAVCQPECGTPTPKGEQLIINGVSAKRGELPWHAGIYLKAFTPYMQICGGSLVSTTVVITAAHCFWVDGSGLQSVQNYAVALGKLYRPWSDPSDRGVHKSDVSDIRIPVRFMGEQTNFQDDIALVIMSTPVVYVTYIRPVCINFDVDFDNRQLISSNMGKVVGWGLTEEDGLSGSPVLKTAEIPYVDIQKCISDLPISFRSHITSDKICAGYLNSHVNLCKGDSGGGLVFPDTDLGIQRYYLRGVVSTAPTNGHRCNIYTYTSFTHVLKHASFIKENGLGPDGRQSSPVSCDINPEAAHCVSTTTERPRESGRGGPVVSRPLDADPRSDPPSNHDEKPMSMLRDKIKLILGKMRGG